MLIKFYGELREQCADVELDVCNIQQVMAALKMLYGQEVSDQLMHNPYYYLLSTNDEPDKLLPLSEGMITMPFDQFDNLLITPSIEGDIIWWVVILVVAIVLAVAVSMLAPSPEFDSDPSEAQRKDSSLFKGPPNINEQGGSVPLNFGKSLAGGVVISAGLYAEDA